MKTHYDYAVVIVLVALVVMFFMLVGGCSAFQDKKRFSNNCSAVCEDCGSFEIDCDSELKSEKEGDDKGVNVINDLGGLVK